MLSYKLIRVYNKTKKINCKFSIFKFKNFKTKFTKKTKKFWKVNRKINK